MADFAVETTGIKQPMVHISFYSHQISTTLCLRNCLFLSCQRWNDNISPQVNESVGRFAMYWHFPWKVNIHRCGVPTKLARTRMLSDTPEWEHPKPYNSNPSSSNCRQSFWSVKSQQGPVAASHSSHFDFGGYARAPTSG